MKTANVDHSVQGNDRPSTSDISARVSQNYTNDKYKTVLKPMYFCITKTPLSRKEETRAGGSGGRAGSGGGGGGGGGGKSWKLAASLVKEKESGGRREERRREVIDRV